MLATLLLAATPSPTPTPKIPNADLVTPGVWGFVITLLIAVATILLIWDMMRRVRRARYRAEVNAKLDAEEAQHGTDTAEQPAFEAGWQTLLACLARLHAGEPVDVGATELAVLEQLLTWHDSQLAVTPVHELMAANQRFARSLNLNP